ncbi:DUF5668 domain-containing protein [Niallia sp. XMNu-256]|uniref:LiaF transmembrane domain-containing protein n=1 Tax=Niallia sp. XMNu-256 TaxID=3082444 RepID=UPI0030CFE1A4
MNHYRYFSGIILLGFGIYFFGQQTNITLLNEYRTWPTLLIIVGLALLAQGYKGQEYEVILPGVIVAGFGFHFHVVERFSIWPDASGALVLFIALGLVLRYQKTGNGLIQGIIFLAIAGLIIFYDNLLSWLGSLGNNVDAIIQYWPLLLMILGIYLLFIKKK